MQAILYAPAMALITIAGIVRHRGSIPRAIPFAILALTVLLGGCSKFETDWRSAELLKPPADGDPFAGRWKGHWKSTQSGHSGNLRCIVRPGIAAGDQRHYAAHFHATYALLLRFEYEADMTAVDKDGRVEFSGQADLGQLAGGVYHYDGHADGNVFHCDYRSGSDKGYFELKRPK